MAVEGCIGPSSYTWGCLERDRKLSNAREDERKVLNTYRNPLEVSP